MSRIGKHAVALPSGVDAKIDGNTITAKGKLGSLVVRLDPEVNVSMVDGKISVQPRDKSREARSKWGMSRTLVNNLVTGVATGYTRKLIITGVGYRAALQGKELVLSLGYSHEVRFRIPDGITIAVEKQTEVTITGADRQKVGQVAADIRSYREPEPYKGKGIRYDDEVILRKEGKKK